MSLNHILSLTEDEVSNVVIALGRWYTDSDTSSAKREELKPTMQSLENRLIAWRKRRELYGPE